MRSAKTCVLVISLLESHIKHDPIAEIASLGCTVVEQESDKIESAGPAKIIPENDVKQHAIAMDQEHEKLNGRPMSSTGRGRRCTIYLTTYNIERCTMYLTMYNIEPNLDSEEESPPASQLE